MQFGELGDVVDVFVIGESNRTTSGEPNELLLLPKMRNEGFLKEYHHKILYVMIPSTDFPEDPSGGGWISDAFIRNYLGQKGLSRIDGELRLISYFKNPNIITYHLSYQFIIGIQDDDLVVLTDADEFITKYTYLLYIRDVFINIEIFL